jgi:hypothetical protein
MDTTALITAIDAEIAKLQLARQTLVALSTTGTTAKRRGRPAKKIASAPVSGPKKRTISAEARARIAAAQKKRWASQRRAAKKTV